ncbi:cupin domain-containing protein [Novosphingobium sp. BL-8A]|uniref:cupin domain-containing protein n=1 Tax=Novosphingobium sp. BL-8A TaxID=3127639 RepID=UPI0037577DD3
MLVGILWIMAHQSPPESAPPQNLFVVEAESAENEQFEDLLCRPGIRIERIVSHGHVTPPDQPYLQDWDEWVLVLEGAAELLLNGTDKWTLAAGDHLLIPAGTPHLVTYTAEPTVWLAIHMGES